MKYCRDCGTNDVLRMHTPVCHGIQCGHVVYDDAATAFVPAAMGEPTAPPKNLAVFRSKDGLTLETTFPDCRNAVRTMLGGGERVYRLYGQDARGVRVFVEAHERDPVSFMDDPSNLKKERDALKREVIDVNARNADWIGMNKRLGAERDRLLEDVAFMKRELERLRPKKRGL